MRLFKERQLEFDGTVVVTDPCYLINNESWDQYCDHLFGDSGLFTTDEFNSGRVDTTHVIEYRGIKLLCTSTKYGDGQYCAGHGTFCVDSGSMCVVHLDDLDSLGIECPDNGCGAVITDVRGNVRGDSFTGAFTGAVNVYTDDSAWYEDEPDDEPDGYY